MSTHSFGSDSDGFVPTALNIATNTSDSDSEEDHPTSTAPPTITHQECLEHLQGFVKGEKVGLSTFYDDDALVAKATLGTAMITKLLADGCSKRVAKDLAVLTLYDIVMLIDDSPSMEHEEGGTRKETVIATLKEITNVYDLANPEGILSVRFLNSDRGKRNVTNAKVAGTFNSHTYTGITRLGTELEGKILNPFLWNPKCPMKKPLLVIVITDGEVEGEKRGLLESVITNCVAKLTKDHKMGKDAVAFYFSRVGNDPDARELLESLSSHRVVGKYISCLPVTERLENISDTRHRWRTLRKLLVGAIVQEWTWSAFDRYNLETHFRDDGGVVHMTYKIDQITRERTALETRWTDGKEIGSGGFGSVTLQKDAGGSLRAVKRLFTRPGIDYSMELKALSVLSNRGDLFVRFLGWYKRANSLFIAMEFMEYGDLSQYMRSKTSTPGSGETPRSNAREITRQVLEGLAVLHGRNICHRDLKPQNILIASLQPIWVKIADFGASIYLKGTLLQDGVGTKGYLAPELLQPQKGYSFAVDLWALGCIVHEMLTSQLPFTTQLEAASTWCSGLVTETGPLFQTERIMLDAFCKHEIPFPAESLQRSGASDHETAFVKALLLPEPSLRLSALAALKTAWLLETSHVMKNPV